ncbi:MAG: DMT family transporter [Planctomycetaceae bacterium]|nr:DMT family transporter [Planctomycetaceae bacterium]
MKQDYEDDRQPIGASSAALAVLVSVLWGGTPVAIKYSQDVFPPIGVAAARFLLAAGFMVFWCRIRGTSLRLEPGQWKPSLVAGILLSVQIGLFHVGLSLSSPSHGSLLINTFVLWVAGIEHFVTRTDRLRPRRITGLLIAASGVVIVLTLTGGDQTAAAQGLDQPSIAGDLLLLGSGFLLAVKIIYTKQAMRTIPPARLILWHDIVGMTLLAAGSLLLESQQIARGQFTTAAMLGLLYQGLVVAGFCFAVQSQLLKRHPAARLSVFAFTTPIFGVMIASLFREGPPSPWLLVAGAAVALGIAMVNWPESP